MPVSCAYFKENICRSCTLLQTDYSAQILLKEKALIDALSPVSLPLLATVTSSETGFRNKAKLVVTGTSETPVLGLIDREILDCPVHDPAINKILHDLIPFIRVAKLEPYQIKEKKGELKGIIIFSGDESYVRFVLRSKEGLDRIRKNLPSLLTLHPEIKSVSVNIQPVHQAILEGDEEIPLGPENFIGQKYKNFSLHIRPQGFVQTNQQVARKLYETAAAWVDEQKISRFMELFSGQGAFSFHSASFVKEATGIELNPEAVKMANESAVTLGLKHLTFVPLPAENSAKMIAEKKPELILVNPPRRGLADTLNILLQARPEYIIYSSCSVESLGKDLKSLIPFYTPERAQIFDMFPHTEHFETLVLLKRLSPVKA
ncbi:MAG: 23S rRNA (uracil(747)-C(5))-methyltransferase [Bdellovibrionota bacterium]